MAAAFFLRVGVAVSSDWIYRVDEIPEHLEQAHRLVFGYGIVPWGYHYGARNWLAIMPAATTLKLFQLMGLGHPDYYVPAVKILNATLSMAVPAGLYFFLRRHLSEIAARAGFVFCCFWWEFLIFAPHTLPSQYGGVLIAAGLGCMATPGGLFRLFLCGFLLGLAGMLRLQYAPVAGLLGLIYLLSLPLSECRFLCWAVWRRCCRPDGRTICFGEVGGTLIFNTFGLPLSQSILPETSGRKIFPLPRFCKCNFFPAWVCMPFCSF